MRKIILISDTHGHLDNRLLKHFDEADEIWHAGDIGEPLITDELKKIKPLQAVYGNIDNQHARLEFQKNLLFTCESVKVYMTHICGQPTNYLKEVKDIIAKEKPQLFICGHSHILKVMYQKQYDVLHLNPGACGNHGFHQLKTALRFTIEGADIKDLAIIELGNK